MAHYADGVKVLTGVECSAAIVAVETVRPYCVMAAPLSDDLMACGLQERNQLLADVAHAKTVNHWPGYHSPEVWELPDWKQAGEEPIELTVGGETIRV